MRINRRQWLQLGCAAAGGAALPALLRAQPAYPSQPLRLIVPFTAGSTTDVIGRSVAERLERGFGQPVIVENRPGAGGVLGAGQVAGAAADGYTALVHSAGHLANASLYPNLKYDTLKDFIPVTMLASMPNVVVAANVRAYQSLQDLVARARAEPGRYTYGSSGNGSVAHIAGEKFRAATGLEVMHVPYRGTPEAVNDVIAGRVDWFFLPLALALPMVKSGKLTALAISAERRSPLLPAVPTTGEAGFDNVDHLFWVGLFLPARVPDAIVKRLHDDTIAALRSDVLKSRFENLGAEPAPMEQARFAQLVADEMARVTTLIQQAGIRAGG
ncbi:tripartite tricarboxylate transporter substrate binding protein [Bordetella hinzii]|uniref:tripartite tricarboxylate transporter substrate binding protein n=1 Tax=Bordetella hinzii TaxID=103855 RepID=UPI0039FBF4C1